MVTRQGLISENQLFENLAKVVEVRSCTAAGDLCDQDLAECRYDLDYSVLDQLTVVLGGSSAGLWLKADDARPKLGGRTKGKRVGALQSIKGKLKDCW